MMGDPGFKLKVLDARYWLFKIMLLCILYDQEPLRFSDDNQDTGKLPQQHEVTCFAGPKEDVTLCQGTWEYIHFLL